MKDKHRFSGNVLKSCRRSLSFAMILLMLFEWIPVALNVPFARSSAIIMPDYTWYGDGSAAEFTINSEGALLGFSNIVNGLDGKSMDNFVGNTVNLTANLNMGELDWKPIGDNRLYPGPEPYGGPFFEGTFNGNYYCIKGITVNIPENGANVTQYGGLFGVQGGSSVIKNLVLASPHISVAGGQSPTISSAGGGAYAGSIAGLAKGLIENCIVTNGVISVSCNANGSSDVAAGGIAGRATGIMQYSSFDGIVTAEPVDTGSGYYADQSKIPPSLIGGVVGDLRGSLHDCLATGSITNNIPLGTFYPKAYAGGIVGLNNSTLLINSFFSGVIAGNDEFGAPSIGGTLGGTETSSEAIGCYYNSETLNNVTETTGTGLTRLEISRESSFVGWDFVSNWSMTSIRPIPKVQYDNMPTAGNVTLSEVNQVGQTSYGNYSFVPGTSGITTPSAIDIFVWQRDKGTTSEFLNNFSNSNLEGGGTPPTIVFEDDLYVGELWTYHINEGAGSQAPGVIRLVKSDGTVYGPWQTAGYNGDTDLNSNVINTKWIAFPNMNIPAGEYTLYDSEPATWSTNAAISGQGMYTIYSKTYSGDYSTISGEGNATYTLTKNDLGSKLRWIVTVVDGAGNSGTPVASNEVGPIAMTSLPNEPPVISTSWAYTEPFAYNTEYPFTISVSDYENTVGTSLYSYIDTNPAEIYRTFTGAPEDTLIQYVPIMGSISSGNHTLNYYAVDANGGTSNLITLPFSILGVPSADAYLSSLTIDHGTLSPEFNSSIFEYATTVPNEIETLTVNAVGTVSSNSVVSINSNVGTSHQVSLAVGNTPINISVTSEDQQITRQYQIMVTRTLAPPPQPPSMPFASEVSLYGTGILGNTLNGIYSYHNNSGLAESGTTYTWERDEGITELVLDNYNAHAVNGGGTSSTFTLSEPTFIGEIWTYHWNNGEGTATLGTISLLKGDSQTIYGPWRTIGSSEPAVPEVIMASNSLFLLADLRNLLSDSNEVNTNWVAFPNVILPEGTYTLIDSEPTTWSSNTQSQGLGMSKVFMKTFEDIFSSIEGAESQQYTLSTGDLGCKVRFGVTVSDVADYSGDTVYSPALGPINHLAYVAPPNSDPSPNNNPPEDENTTTDENTNVELQNTPLPSGEVNEALTDLVGDIFKNPNLSNSENIEGSMSKVEALFDNIATEAQAVKTLGSMGSLLDEMRLQLLTQPGPSAGVRVTALAEQLTLNTEKKLALIQSPEQQVTVLTQFIAAAKQLEIAAQLPMDDMKQSITQMLQNTANNFGKLEIQQTETGEVKLEVAGVQNAIQKQLEGIKQLNALQDQFFDAGTNKSLKQEITIDIKGSKESSDVRVGIQPEIIELLKGENIQSLAVKNLNIEMKLPVSELALGKDTQLVMEQIAPPVTTNPLEEQPKAVYEFGLMVNEQPQEKFSRPITLTFSLASFGYEKESTEVLSVYKLNTVQMRWEPVGGIVDPQSGSIFVTRDNLSQYTVLKSKKSFSDADQSWAKVEINAMLNKGIVTDTAKFEPKSVLTRGEFATWIANAYGLKVSDKGVPFKDVPKDSAYYNAVAAVYQQGILVGNKGKFNPDKPLTQNELAAALGKVLVSFDNKQKSDKVTSKHLSALKTTQVASWADDDMALLMELGFNATAKSGGDKVTKEAAASAFMKFYKS